MPVPGPDPTVSDRRLLQTIHDHYAPAVGSGHIADTVHLSQQAVSKRLEQLVDDDLVATTKVGQSRIYWLTTDGKLHLSPASDENEE